MPHPAILQAMDPLFRASPVAVVTATPVVVRAIVIDSTQTETITVDVV